MTKNIVIKKDESLILPIIWFGKEKKINYNIDLTGVNSSVTCLMLLLGKEDNKARIQVSVIHKNKETKSKIIVKGILEDKSNIDFNGLVRIERNSKGSNAWLSAKLMLLSDKTQGQIVPALEILENDVKAGHETAIGKINEEELFYLMSRGISEAKAKNAIVQGFLSEFLKSFPEGKIKKRIRKELKYDPFD